MSQPFVLPAFEPRTHRTGLDRNEIFDPVRKKFVALTPEEWVRQHFLNYLVNHRHYPLSLIGVEVPLVYNRRKKRGDIVVFGRNGQPLILVECKAPEVPVTAEVFSQAAMYDRVFGARYIVLSNGLTTLICRLDKLSGQIVMEDDLPFCGLP